MGSESRLEPGIVVGAMPAISSLMGGLETRRGVHTFGWIMESGRGLGCVIRAYHKYPRLTNEICFLQLDITSSNIYSAY